MVADPQIVGPEWNNFFIDWIAVFDSDRYIKRTFTRAFNYVKPDVTVFLGDLMDQAYMASHSEYVSYINRLQNIFELSRLSRQNKIVICPGDNDVGGIDEDLKPSSVYRFDKTFNLTVDSTIIDFIEFCNANLMTFQLQPSKKINEDFLRIALSHVPLVPKKSYFLNEVSVEGFKFEDNHMYCLILIS